MPTSVLLMISFLVGFQGFVLFPLVVVTLFYSRFKTQTGFDDVKFQKTVNIARLAGICTGVLTFVVLCFYYKITP